MPLQRAVTPPRTRSIPGTNPYSKVQTGASITPSRLMNSWTWMVPIPFPPRCSREILNYYSVRHGAVDALHDVLTQLRSLRVAFRLLPQRRGCAYDEFRRLVERLGDRAMLVRPVGGEDLVGLAPQKHVELTGDNFAKGLIHAIVH